MKPNPYRRAFVVSGGLFLFFIVYSVTGMAGYWKTNALVKLGLIAALCLVTGLVTGFIASRKPSLCSWTGLVALGLVSCFGLIFLGKAILDRWDRTPMFASTDEMMVYFAKQAAGWVRQDTGTNLDYSLASIQLVEDRLGRLSNEINRTNPPPGTFGMAMGYGAYIGEVLRRNHGGSWAADHPAGGQRSFPLALTNNQVVFPVIWCYKRIINGEEDNVYHKALLAEQFSESNALTNAPALPSSGRTNR